MGKRLERRYKVLIDGMSIFQKWVEYLRLYYRVRFSSQSKKYYAHYLILVLDKWQNPRILSLYERHQTVSQQEHEMTDPNPQIIGRRAGEKNEITIETIRATGKELGLTESQIAKVIEALLKSQQEQE